MPNRCFPSQRFVGNQNHLRELHQKNALLDRKHHGVGLWPCVIVARCEPDLLHKFVSAPDFCSWLSHQSPFSNHLPGGDTGFPLNSWPFFFSSSQKAMISAGSLLKKSMSRFQTLFQKRLASQRLAFEEKEPPFAPWLFSRRIHTFSLS